MFTPGKLTQEEALANLVLTSIFNSTCRLGAKLAPAEVIALAKQCPPGFVARLAVFAYEQGKLKDTSALLVAFLTTVKAPEHFWAAAPRVLNNMGQIRKFVNYKRGGLLGSKSLGSTAKSYVKKFFAKQTPAQLFYNSIGSNPSVGDVIRLAHCRPESEQDGIYKYLLGYDLDLETLPDQIRLAVKGYKQLSAGTWTDDDLPEVPAAMLENTISKMTPGQKVAYLEKLTPNQLRRQANTLAKAGVFTLQGAMEIACDKLRRLSTEKILPLSLVASCENIQVPELQRVLIDILDTSLNDAVEVLAGSITRPMAVAIDVSGSMTWPLSRFLGLEDKERNPYRHRSVMELAALLVYPLSRHPMVDLFFVSDEVKRPAPGAVKDCNSIQEFMTLVAGFLGGGTRLSETFTAADGATAPDVFIISDNESWQDKNSFHKKWEAYTSKFAGKVEMPPRLLLWDVVPTLKAPLHTDVDILNLNGISENIYDVAATYLGTEKTLVQQINEVALAY